MRIPARLGDCRKRVAPLVAPDQGTLAEVASGRRTARAQRRRNAPCTLVATGAVRSDAVIQPARDVARRPPGSAMPALGIVAHCTKVNYLWHHVRPGRATFYTKVGSGSAFGGSGR